jgi:hypothetical protein
MPTYERLPQRLADWLNAGNVLPDFAADHGITSEVSVAPDGTVTIETDATGQAISDALDGITADDIDPETPRRAEYAAIMAQLDAFADAVEAGQTPPTVAQTQAAVARLVRVVQHVTARRN